MPFSRTIIIQDIGPVLLERSSRAKRMNISIRPFKGIRVAVPAGVSFNMAEEFAHSRKRWLLENIPRIRKIEDRMLVNETKPPINREEAKTVLASRLEHIARKFGYTYNRLTVRNQKTRWGSCSSKNNISLNIKLTLLPDELRDYIILHELVHTRVKNHGGEFWAEIKKVEPRAEELAGMVRQYCLAVL